MNQESRIKNFTVIATPTPHLFKKDGRIKEGWMN